MINKLVTFTIAIFFFLFPLFYLTSTSESYEYNKMFLLFFAVTLLFFFYNLKIVTQKKMSLKGGTFSVLLFFLTGIVVVSTLFQSPNVVIALTTPLSTGTILAGFVLYLLLINTPLLTDGPSDRLQIKQPKIPFLKTRVLGRDDRLSESADTWPMGNETYDEGKESEKHGIEDASRRQDPQGESEKFVSEGLPISILMNILTISALLLSLYSLLLFTGILPRNFFTPAGSILPTALFLSVITVYLLTKIVTRIIYESGKRRPEADQPLAEKVTSEKPLAGGPSEGQDPQLLLYLLALLLIGGTTIFLIIQLFTSQKPMVLPLGFGWIIFLEILKNIKTLFLGVGPANFLTAFTLGKPLLFNQAPVWNVIFTSSSSFFLNLATESGILAGILYTGILLKAIKLIRSDEKNSSEIFTQQDKISAGRIRNREASLEIEETLMIKEGESDTTLLQEADTLRARKFLSASEDPISRETHKLQSQKFVSEYLPYILALIFALTIQLFLPSNMPLFITTIILLAFVSSGKEAITVDFSRMQKSVYLLLVPAIIVTGLVIYFGGRAYLAEMAFKNSLDALVNNNGKEAYESQQQAITLNPYLDRYHSAFSQVNLALANALAGKTPLEESDKQNIPRLVQQAIDHARAAVSLNRTNTAAWDNLSKIYAALGNYAQGADNWALQSYEQRISLDPLNPLARLSLGGFYLSLKKYQEAENLFRETIRLKPDFANAYFNLGVALRGQKKYPESYQAFQNALSLVTSNSTDSAKVQEEIKLIPSQFATGSGGLKSPVTETQTLEPIESTPSTLNKLPKNAPTISLQDLPITP